MNSILLILAFIARAHAVEEKAQTSANTEQSHATTEQVTDEDQEAMNKLIDILVDDDKNDELVDMIADKLVNKLLGFSAAVLPQQAQAVMPATEIRQFLQNPQQVQFGGPKQAPQVNVAYDNSKNVKLGEDRDGVALSRNKNYNSVKDTGSSFSWGIGETIKGGQNPYGIEAKPVGDRPTDTTVQNNGPPKIAYKPGPEYATMGSSQYEKLMGKDGFGAARPMDKALDTLQGLGRVDGGTRPNLMEMDEEQPDVITVLAVGLLSACVGSAVTFALFRIGRVAKTGMEAPLLTY